MKFRPCIDIHDGQVKQIVGGSLTDGQGAAENFVSMAGADFYGFMYAMNNLEGGHIILLNKAGTPEYEADCEQARKALKAFPGGFMVGGGVTDENANGFIRMGAKQVLVTSFVFKDGKIDYDNQETHGCHRQTSYCAGSFLQKERRRQVLHCDRSLAEVYRHGAEP